MEVPTIDDFAVELRNRFVVFTWRGEPIASFPEWEDADRDLRHFAADDVPFGTIDEPFEDAGPSWRIVIYEDEGFVYIFEADSPHATDFPRRYRVPLDDYFEAWALVLTKFNPVLPLED